VFKMLTLNTPYAVPRIHYLNIVCNIVDVNECNEALDTCEQLCQNTPGSYICSCRQGYTFNSTTNHCDAGKENA